MPRLVVPMSALAVARLRSPGLTAVGGVPGLYLAISATGQRRWVFRVLQDGRRSDVALGPFPEVPLALAREQAQVLRAQIRSGVNVAEERRESKRRRRAALAAGLKPDGSRDVPLFRDYAEAWIDAHEGKWKNEKHGQQWRNTLATYVYPKFGHVHVDLVETAHVLEVLRPIWAEKTETARRVMQRMKRVLDAATAEHLRQGANPARWSEHLDQILPAPTEITEVEHHAAMPFDEIPDFVARLASRRGYSNQGLLFLILTAARSQELLLMQRSDVDYRDRVWDVRDEAMKTGRPHYVPLTTQALELLANVPQRADSVLMFPGQKRGQPMSGDTLMAALRRGGGGAYTVHGMRSTFRDWVAERTNFDGDLAEMALAHKVTDKTEAAYRRGVMLERRRELMQAWATFCFSRTPAGALTAAGARGSGRLST